MKPTVTTQQGTHDALARVLAALRLPVEILREILHGFRASTIPLHWCCLWGAAVSVALTLKWDLRLFERLGVPFLYPRTPTVYYAYLVGAELSGFFAWGVLQVALRRRLLRRLRDVLVNAGLKNNLGKLPGFISDTALDAETRKLRLSRACLQAEKFEAARGALESGLQVFIDAVKENREGGSIDILYSQRPMPTLTKVDDIRALPSCTFLVGMARGSEIRLDLREVPHLLVAGETSSGKSTFLRQVVTTLLVNNRGMELSLVDLKGGLEFSLFAGVERTTVIASLGAVLPRLVFLEAELERRMAMFADVHVKDIDAYNAGKGSGAQRRARLGRHVLVVDEIAELFLAGADRPAKDVQKARAIVSRLARQGRALGIHLVLGTQRPDARALDTQIKANLPGKVCFQMADIASSMVVLGNARARELPGVPGRAIWQRGLTMTEVRTPFLSPEEAEELLAPLRSTPRADPVQDEAAHDQAVRP